MELADSIFGSLGGVDRATISEICTTDGIDRASSFDGEW